MRKQRRKLMAIAIEDKMVINMNNISKTYKMGSSEFNALCEVDL